MACVALPTCGLALAESERYLPSLVTALEERLAANGLADDEIVIRMTGLPERLRTALPLPKSASWAKDQAATIFISAPPLTARGSPSSMPKTSITPGSSPKLDPLFAAYAAERKPGERFGGFVIRAGFVAPTTNGADFHANTGAQRAE